MEKMEAGDGCRGLSCITVFRLIVSRSGALSGNVNGASRRHFGGPGVVLKELEIVGCNTAVIIVDECILIKMIVLNDFNATRNKPN